jgi:hypothetical protein
LTSLPSSNPLSHTFVFTVDDSGVVHTYSWGNSANPTGWNKDQIEDIFAAYDALEKGYGELVGCDNLDPFVDYAYEFMRRFEQEHPNGGINNNCKTEASDLIDFAQNAMNSFGNDASQLQSVVNGLDSFPGLSGFNINAFAY